MTIPEGYTQEQWDDLTEAEQEGILSDDGSDEEEEEEQEEEQGGANTPEDDEQPDPKAVKKAGEEEPGTGKPAEQEEQEEPEEEQTERQRTRVDMFKAAVPEDIETQRTALDSREDTLVQKFDDGDITFAEYNKGIRELNSERGKLDRLELKAELAAEANQSRTQEDWANTCTDFTNEHPLIQKNATLWNAFDMKVREVTAQTMKDGRQIGRRDLEKAYKLLQEDLGIREPAKAEPEKPAKKGKKPIDVPPTLGKVPAAQTNDTDDGKYAHLDRLAETDPERYEAALLKMSDAERDAYMQAG